MIGDITADAQRRAQTWSYPQSGEPSRFANMTYNEIADVLEFESLQQWERDFGSMIASLVDLGRMCVTLLHGIGVR